jgi:hypothetical protein
MYLASSLGVLASIDGGAQWAPAHPGLPAVVDAIDLAVQRTTTPSGQPSIRLWLATYGHGLWRRDVIDDPVFRDGFEAP